LGFGDYGRRGAARPAGEHDYFPGGAWPQYQAVERTAAAVAIAIARRICGRTGSMMRQGEGALDMTASPVKVAAG